MRHVQHGWSLGENGDFLKFSLTELGTRVPLLIKTPHIPHVAGRRTSALVELVDLLPTMAELAGLPPVTIHDGDAPLDGISLAALFAVAPPAQLKPHVLAQFPRCPADPDFHGQNASDLWFRNLCINTPAAGFSWMGYSLRDAQWRYNAWFRWNGSALGPIIVPEAGEAVPVNGTDGFYNELFRYDQQPLTDFDSVELVELGPSNPHVVAKMHATLLVMISAA